MKIKLNGKLVENYHNDLHNTFSPKNHKPHFVPSYKNLYRNQLATNKGLLIANGLLALTTVGIIVGCNIRTNGKQAEIEALKHELERTMVIAADNVDSYNKLESELASCSAKLNQKKLTGKVSFYSENGCLGCNKNLITSSGDRLDDTKRTIALPLYMQGKLKLGTVVTIKNLDNGLSTTAVFNDYGGFAKYNRIGDLSVAACEAVNCKTDLSNIQITWY